MTTLRVAARSARRRASILRVRLMPVDRVATWAETWVRMRRRPVLLYSVEKAGTTSLTEAIERATALEVVKAHSLVQSRIRSRPAKESYPGRPRFWWESEAIAAYLTVDRSTRWTVLTAVRDPVARAASTYFYHAFTARRDVPSHDVAVHGVEAMLHRIAFEEDWFTDELLAVTGIDVYTRRFPHDRGWDTYESSRFRVMVIRTENLRSSGPSAVAGFLELPQPLPIPTVNETTPSERSAYRRFLTEWRPRADLVDAVYGTRLATHFYSDDERTQLKEKWTSATSSTRD